MAATTQVGSIKKFFTRLKDPRVTGRTDHLLVDIVVIAICGVIANCDDWKDITQFAKYRLSWFKRFLKLPNGIPSHYTIRRVFNLLDPHAFSRCCVEWLRVAANLVAAGHVAIDGKTLRGSASSTLKPLHLVSAWASEANVTLGEVAVKGKSNEITAIPKLLELLDLKGALVTIDAMGCQKAIAGQIVDRGGDFALAVKGNQEHLLEDVQETVQKALDGELPKRMMASHTTIEKGRGRQERRTYIVINNLDGIRDRKAWPGLKVVGMCCRERTVKGETTLEAHYFIGSRRMGARRYAEALRRHWTIENCLHWQLDVSFGEDASRIQNVNAAENFSTLRKMALGQLKRHPAKLSIALKRKTAAINLDFLNDIVTGTGKIEGV